MAKVKEFYKKYVLSVIKEFLKSLEFLLNYKKSRNLFRLLVL